jgi:Spy/CpxP family protein refolding chaperone
MITPAKYRLLLWLVFILIALNVATVVSLIYHTMQDKKQVSVSQHSGQSRGEANRGATFFREQLNLDPGQISQFSEINDEYNLNTRRISFELELLRQEIVKEMGKPESDTVKLNELSRKIGLKHEELKKLTTNYYLRMKSCCNEEQQMKLNSIFKEMVQPGDSAGSHQGKGKGPRWRGGRN